jgi:hypothetical protein
MNGNLMYEMARQRVAEQQRTARQAREARGWRAIARGRHARAEAEVPALPAIPDFPHELLGHQAGNTVPAPRTAAASSQQRTAAASSQQRPEAVRGRHARTTR